VTVEDLSYLLSANPVSVYEREKWNAADRAEHRAELARQAAESAELADRSATQRTLFHDPQGDVWARHASGLRDHEADARTAADMRAERFGDFDPSTGQWAVARDWRPA
jgi:hypothetical protein